MTVVWKGAISFGLINIPVKLHVATKSRDIRFRLLHKDCKQPLNQKRWCAKCNKEVSFDDAVKGYEYEKGRFVIISEEEFDNLPVKSARYVQIMDFVNLSDIDPIYYENAYFLRPEVNGEKAYLLLRDAMRETGKAAVAKITVREKEHLCVIRRLKETLCLETLYFADELRDSDEAEIQKMEKKFEVAAAEREMAIKLVESLAAKFEIEKYRDQYREELLKLIRAKIDGEEITEVAPPEIDASKVVDLMARLRQSVELASKKTANY